MGNQTPLGTIDISPRAIATLVQHVAMQTYGVAGLTEPTRRGQITATLTRDPNRGIGVQYHDEDQITITVHIVMNYGINIVSVANSLISSIRYHVETNTGQSVQQVNIIIQGLHGAE